MATGDQVTDGSTHQAPGRRADPAGRDTRVEDQSEIDEFGELAQRQRMQELAERIRLEASRAFSRDS
jgi:hypothetical protein